jgi:hypothetical protein
MDGLCPKRMQQEKERESNWINYKEKNAAPEYKILAE